MALYPVGAPLHHPRALTLPFLVRILFAQRQEGICTREPQEVVYLLGKETFSKWVVVRIKDNYRAQGPRSDCEGLLIHVAYVPCVATDAK